MGREGRDLARGESTDPQDEPLQPRLGCATHPRRVAQAWYRHWGDERGHVHGSSSQAAFANLATFLTNRLQQLVVVDFFVVPTLMFRILFVLVVLVHDRRRILHFKGTAYPTAERTAQQIREAFPWETARRLLLRNRDGIYGKAFWDCATAMGIDQVRIAPQSPWQNPYVEQLLGSIRRECLDHVIVFNERSLRRTLRSYVDYHQCWRTHLALGKDAPITRKVQPPKLGQVLEIPEVGGLHHRYERQAA